jgi:hypothetical protein
MDIFFLYLARAEACPTLAGFFHLAFCSFHFSSYLSSAFVPVRNAIPTPAVSLGTIAERHPAENQNFNFWTKNY